MTAFAAIIPPAPAPKVKLEWDYPPEQLSTNLSFNIYHTTNISVPITEWKVLTNVVGTNLSVTLPKENGAHFFALTASNASGESSFATVSP